MTIFPITKATAEPAAYLWATYNTRIADTLQLAIIALDKIRDEDGLRPS